MRGRSARLPPAHCGLRMSAWSTCWLAPSRGRVCAGAPLRRSAPKARRLRCGARVSVALRNSLHSLRSLRSDSRSESVHEVRGYARRPKPCAPRRRTGAPAHTRPRLGEAPVFFVGEGHKPGIEPGSRPVSAPAARGKPRARCPWLAQHSPQERLFPQGGGWGAGGANGAAEKHRAEVGARSALRDLTHRECLSATSAVSEASFAVRPQTEHRREPSRSEGERRLSPDCALPAALLAHRPLRRAFPDDRERTQRADCGRPFLCD